MRKKTKTPIQAGLEKMRVVDESGAQGDVMFRRVSAIPKDYVEQKPTAEIVVAHSETGHHHTVSGCDAVLFSKPGDNMLSYLQMTAGGVLPVMHHRSYDTHDPMGLKGEPGTVWEIRRQRESAPEGWRQVAD